MQDKVDENSLKHNVFLKNDLFALAAGKVLMIVVATGRQRADWGRGVRELRGPARPWRAPEGCWSSSRGPSPGTSRWRWAARSPAWSWRWASCGPCWPGPSRCSGRLETKRGWINDGLKSHTHSRYRRNISSPLIHVFCYVKTCKLITYFNTLLLAGKKYVSDLVKWILLLLCNIDFVSVHIQIFNIDELMLVLLFMLP